jgi:hypothetical protein
MWFQQGKRQSGRIKPILASDQLERRSIRELVALVRRDLMASPTLVLGNVLSALRIRCERGRCAQSNGYQNPANCVHTILSPVPVSMKRGKQ